MGNTNFNCRKQSQELHHTDKWATHDLHNFVVQQNVASYQSIWKTFATVKIQLGDIGNNHDSHIQTQIKQTANFYTASKTKMKPLTKSADLAIYDTILVAKIDTSSSTMANSQNKTGKISL